MFCALCYVLKYLPLKYLGCPLFVGRNKIHYYGELIAKIKNKLSRWKGKLLSYREA